MWLSYSKYSSPAYHTYPFSLGKYVPRIYQAIKIILGNTQYKHLLKIYQNFLWQIISAKPTTPIATGITAIEDIAMGILAQAINPSNRQLETDSKSRHSITRAYVHIGATTAAQYPFYS